MTELQADDNGFAIFNPHNKSIDQLPRIYGFNNGGSTGFMDAVAIAEDGVCLGGHLCTNEGFMLYDLGLRKGYRMDRHENQYQKHYPEGYRMEWVSTDEIDNHEKLQKAFELNKKLAESEANVQAH